MGSWLHYEKIIFFLSAAHEDFLSSYMNDTNSVFKKGKDV